MTPRLTAPQLAVLRALDGFLGWMPAAGRFSANAANSLDVSPLPFVIKRVGYAPCEFKMTNRGRSLVAQLKAEGKL